MIDSSDMAAMVVSGLDDDAQVLDVAGWARPLVRANSIIDLKPYATRATFGLLAGGAERFTKDFATMWIGRAVRSRLLARR